MTKQATQLQTIDSATLSDVSGGITGRPATPTKSTKKAPCKSWSCLTDSSGDGVWKKAPVSNGAILPSE
ncbi:MAG: hypothetical protein AB7O24_15195 [Kofleriaceae bacterium]